MFNRHAIATADRWSCNGLVVMKEKIFISIMILFLAAVVFHIGATHGRNVTLKASTRAIKIELAKGNRLPYIDCRAIIEDILILKGDR